MTDKQIKSVNTVFYKDKKIETITYEDGTFEEKITQYCFEKQQEKAK